MINRKLNQLKKFSKIEIFEKEDNKKYTFTKKAENLIKKHGLNKKIFKFEKTIISESDLIPLIENSDSQYESSQIKLIQTKNLFLFMDLVKEQ